MIFVGGIEQQLGEVRDEHAIPRHEAIGAQAVLGGARDAIEARLLREVFGGTCEPALDEREAGQELEPTAARVGWRGQLDEAARVLRREAPAIGLHLLPLAVTNEVGAREQAIVGKEIGDRVLGPRIERVLAFEADLELFAAHYPRHSTT